MPLKISGSGNVVTGMDFTDHLTPDKVATSAVGSLQITKKDAGETEKLMKEETTELSAPQINSKAEAYSITIGGGRTIPTEPYANVKLLVSITCPATKDTLEDVYEFATDWVSKKMEEAMEGMK